MALAPYRVVVGSGDFVPSVRRVRRLAAVLVAIVGLLVLGAFAPAPARADVPFDQQHFIAAIRNAAVPSSRDVDRHLFALSDANRRLVWRTGSHRRQLAVAIVMTLHTYQSYYASGSGTTPASRPVVWVTLAPQLRSWCRRLARRATPARLRRRLIQRLGLSPSISYARVVELWVDRDRVFRPCPDPAVADGRCQLAMQGTPHVPGIADYPAFFASLYVSSYNADGAPWTRLGYTYDWGGASRFGESEYMLTTDTAYAVRSAPTIPAYCR